MTRARVLRVAILAMIPGGVALICTYRALLLAGKGWFEMHVVKGGMTDWIRLAGAPDVQFACRCARRGTDNEVNEL